MTERALIIFFTILDASSVIAENGISNRLAPLPLNTEPLLNFTLPLNIEPLSIDVTTNPSFGLVDAVTLPLAINGDVSESADNGISNKFLPLPLNTEPLLNLILPLKVEPLTSEVTKNPSSGETEAVTLPLDIWNASSDSAD